VGAPHRATFLVVGRAHRGTSAAGSSVVGEGPGLDPVPAPQLWRARGVAMGGRMPVRLPPPQRGMERCGGRSRSIVTGDV
jgi:hypothetical protein